MHRPNRRDNRFRIMIRIGLWILFLVILGMVLNGTPFPDILRHFHVSDFSKELAEKLNKTQSFARNRQL
ncbi:Neuropeptide-Like Protein [Caenorhabditis elegans]|uniref:Neuropeptide-Like Protein n=1 Tax=Caenorhabditis elegans TaxID=6239 RepID=O16896_CAEEL|nr:Neuropeptide-Like Protein [Caenorhabditis elegans]CCD69363.2 Neuropeptide-Like Protein [Caenorhabditis elegans]|eukprot:NP_001317744.1 Uncharacterized protein CELE_F13A2.1 [Caenorhabditis elegans]